MRRPRVRQAPWLLASLSGIPLGIWWLGWYPGFVSPDTVDQFTQIATGTYSDHHPAIHTFYLEVISTGGIRPGLVAMIQVIGLTVLLTYAAKRLIEAGVSKWAVLGVCWLVGLAPAVGTTTIALWKDVPFALFLVWAWIELFSIGTGAEEAGKRAQWARLGAALAGVWMFRGNGPITVVLLLSYLAWRYRHHLRRLALAPLLGAALVLLVTGPLYAALDVSRNRIQPAQVFLPDLAAAYVSEPDAFAPDELAMLEAVAPLHVWRERYDCFDSTPLVFDPRFDQTAVKARPNDYLWLELETMARHPASLLAHRACAGNFLYSPSQPEGVAFHRPPFEIAGNELGLRRVPKAEWAYEFTEPIWEWAEQEDHLWFTWRPAILLLPALAIAAISQRRAPWLAGASALLIAHTLNVAATSPGQEFRFAYPLYLMSLLTLPLAGQVLRGRGPVRR